MPILPVHHDCWASHWMASTASSCSRGVYSSVLTPSLLPVPRQSNRAPMMPCWAK